ncbi:Kidney carrier protein 1 [Monoraphidium neglectum]|uniref:Kidney carrier protein 1 n=1 Tax=Monoraphidium neglectum TaxID=145388 RepID=A0A0D2LW79_9CHLO|nr:Kidney carrier protein 1 [Monoraphidium neglectum]KIY93811.1 Kidney carrier protein 1 [Monoraphidium neglectum]|eukprot:XP_013892831.1 Kidney carrier protein 1 [Monoraphidium neglectum]
MADEGEGSDSPERAAAGEGSTSDAAAGAARPPNAASRGLMNELLTSGVSVACATVVTNPLDVIKTRMQLRQAQGGSHPGLVATGAEIVRGEGAGALWKGLPPAVLRGLLYGGMRSSVASSGSSGSGDGNSSSGSSGSSGSGGSGSSSSSSGGGNSSSSSSSSSSGNSSSNSSGGGTGGAAPASAGTKLLAGTLSGGVAAAVCSPTELVKVRLQAAGSTHRSALAAARAVVEADGVAGLWKGATPGLVRAAVLTASQCATYDETKRRVMASTGWGDTAATHLACSLITGLASTTATNPIDVVKTHMFVSGRAGGGPLACAAALYRRQGAAGFMRGWWANYSSARAPSACAN